MAVPRKIFRIEEMPAARLEQNIEDSPAALRHAEVMHELAALRTLLAAVSVQLPNKAPAKSDVHPGAATGRLACELNLIQSAVGATERSGAGRDGSPLPAAQLARIGHELDAVLSGTDQATQKILAAAEEIDQTANNLSAALRGKIEQDFAQDIQDLVMQIFEACNFQDLTGQRVGKVMATVKFIEDHVTRVLDEIKNNSPPAACPDATQSLHGPQVLYGPQVLHGPRLAIDPGHVTQNEIDAMFGEP